MKQFLYSFLLVILINTLSALRIEADHYGFKPGAQRNYKQGTWDVGTTDLSEGSGKIWSFSLPQTGYVHNSYFSSSGHPDFPDANLRCSYTQFVNGILDTGTIYLQNNSTDIITLGYTGAPNMVWNPGIPNGLPHTLGKTWQGTHNWTYGAYDISGKVISEGMISTILGSFPALCVRYHYVSGSFSYYYYQWECAEYGIVAYANTLNGNMLYVLNEAEPNVSPAEDLLAAQVPILNVYPNPASDTIFVIPPAKGAWELRLYDIRGRALPKLGNFCTESTPEEIRIELSTLGLAPGIYILQARNGSQTILKRIVIRTQ